LPPLSLLRRGPALVQRAKNVLVAGRCFSATQLALSSARVSTTCAMMGQAAGIAAGLAVEKRCDPRNLDPMEIRSIVERRGAVLT